jgi:hypothetical protein
VAGGGPGCQRDLYAPWDSAPVSVDGVWLGDWHVPCGGGGSKSPVMGPGFTVSINVICVGIRSSLPKMQYRVVMDYVGGPPLSHRGRGGCRLFRGGSYETFTNLGKQRVACGCGFSWLLRVIDHEAVLLDPKLFSGLVPRPLVLLKRRFGRRTADKQPVTPLAKI